MIRVLLVAAAVGAAFPLASYAQDAVARLQEADPAKVVGAGLLHVAMLVASALCWRRAFDAFGGRIGGADACVRSGVGTFVNAVAPARAGGALRIGLFTRSLRGEGAVHRSGTALLAIGSMRAAATTAMLAGAAAGGLAPLWLMLTPIALVAAAIFVRARLGIVRDHLNARCLAGMWGWAALAATCRCGSIAVALAAVGVSSPITAALVGLLGPAVGLPSQPERTLALARRLGTPASLLAHHRVAQQRAGGPAQRGLDPGQREPCGDGAAGATICAPRQP